MLNVDGTARLSGVLRLTGTGTLAAGALEVTELIVDGGYLRLGSGLNHVDSLWFDAGTIGGDGDLTLTGPTHWSGGSWGGAGVTTIAAGAALTIADPQGAPARVLGRVLHNEGQIVWSAGDIEARTDLGTPVPALENAGSMTITGGSRFTGSVSNLAVGTVVLGAGAGLSVGSLTNAGRLEIRAGAILSPLVDFANEASGELAVAIYGSSTLDTGQILLPGGTAHLAGTLALDVLDSSASFIAPLTVIDAADIAGEFDAVVGADLSDGKRIEVIYDVVNGDVVLNIPADLFVADGATGEGDAGVLVVRVDLDQPAQRDVDLVLAASGGTAIVGEDFILPTGTTIHVPAGSLNASVSIDVVDDAIREPDETVEFAGFVRRSCLCLLSQDRRSGRHLHDRGRRSHADDELPGWNGRRGRNAG